ncbi:LysM peptidoglycan-binding domain-containing protein [Limisalsivibrio acetivorans]|uniref:LysM peptidoglycan-binding domain-containing protein n=1 Tax=Limisalsivibrio acetivorans TaxID=1304888 RepID=UPI0003B6BECE|nr:LysM peptidoglycan-binding domain-containing protein [Limisalsivibrio acetivorans]
MNKKLLCVLCAGGLLAASAAAAETVHKVKKGDTLWDISRHYYGDNFQWPMIWKDNVIINDPDLIYPGQQFNVPGFLDDAETIRKDDSGLIRISAPENRKPMDTDPLESEKLINANARNSMETIFLNDIEVVRDNEPSANILNVEGEKSFATTRDRITINQGSGEGLNLGDTVVLYQKLSTLEKERAVYRIVGYAEVSEVRAETSDAIIYKSFNSIQKGYFAEKGNRPDLRSPKVFRKADTDIDGEIVYIPDSHRNTAQGYRVIVNVGSVERAKQGDKVSIYRETEENGRTRKDYIGEGQLILVGEEYSTAIIVTSLVEIHKGDSVNLTDIAVY